MNHADPFNGNNVNFHAIGLDLARRINLELRPWEDQLPEKHLDLIDILAEALAKMRRDTMHQRAVESVGTLSEAELDLLVGKFFRGYWSVLDGFLPLPWRRRWHGGALAMLAAYENIRLTRGERQPAPRQAAE